MTLSLRVASTPTQAMSSHHETLQQIWPIFVGDIARTRDPECNSFWPSLSQSSDIKLKSW